MCHNLKRNIIQMTLTLSLFFQVMDGFKKRDSDKGRTQEEKHIDRYVKLVDDHVTEAPFQYLHPIAIGCKRKPSSAELCLFVCFLH